MFALEMKRKKQRIGLSAVPVWIAAVLSQAGHPLPAFAKEKCGVYECIVKRNSFGLTSPAMRLAESPTQKLIPLQVSLTGVADIGGKKRVFLEVFEPGNPVRIPVLAEGEAWGKIEVLQVDVPSGQARLRVEGVETRLGFQLPKPAQMKMPLDWPHPTFGQIR